MPRLTEEIKRFIVMDLATYRPPTEVATRVREEFGVEVSRQQVHDYHPEKVHKKPVAKKWKDLFTATQKQFLKESAKQPVASKSFRLRELHDMYRRAKERGNLVLAKDLLQQAAKECGGAFTNTREITGKDGKPVEFRDVSELTDEQIEARLAKLMGRDDEP